MKLRSPLIWFGGKSKYAKHIISKMPYHTLFCEPFGGAAHVIVQKERVKHEVYNDIDGNVVNFLMMVRDRPEEMKEACESIPYSRELYERWKEYPLPDDDFARAVRWFYLNRSSIAKGNSDDVPNTGWRHSTTANQNPAKGYISACELFQEFSDRMKGVMIEHADFRTIISKYDGETRCSMWIRLISVGRNIMPGDLQNRIIETWLNCLTKQRVKLFYLTMMILFYSSCTQIGTEKRLKPLSKWLMDLVGRKRKKCF